MPAADRRHKLADVTTKSRDGWRSVTRYYGGNVTALAEVMGLYLAQFEPPTKPPLWLRQLLADAADLEDERRLRPQTED